MGLERRIQKLFFVTSQQENMLPTGFIPIDTGLDHLAEGMLVSSSHCKGPLPPLCTLSSLKGHHYAQLSLKE